MYRCKKMVNDYVIQRIETGKVNNVEHTETRNLYRVKYVAGSETLKHVRTILRTSSVLGKDTTP